MNKEKAFELGFIKAATAKGYTQNEAEAIYKEAARGDFFRKAFNTKLVTNTDPIINSALIKGQSRGLREHRNFINDIRRPGDYYGTMRKANAKKYLEADARVKKYNDDLKNLSYSQFMNKYGSENFYTDMNNFELGFIKAATAKGYTQDEAEAIAYAMHKSKEKSV